MGIEMPFQSTVFLLAHGVKGRRRRFNFFFCSVAVGSGCSHGSEAIEDQRPAEEKKEPFPNDFIRESFCVAEGFRSVALADERRDESFARGKIYLARGATDFPFGH